MILAFDLGTGGAKVCIYKDSGQLLSKTFKAYPTSYPARGYHVQDPHEWWNAVVSGTRELLEQDKSYSRQIRSIALSGQSLAVIPLNGKGEILFKDIPIWSDTRAGEQAGKFFGRVDQEEWYSRTGNGFTPECYSLFKIMWYRDNYPEEFKKAERILGSKDYINYRLTGNMATDYSYASGLGAYDLKNRKYDSEFLNAAGIREGLLPVPGPSDECIGTLMPAAASELSLPGSVKVYCGGVDNSCMALGARNLAEGRVYLSLGSSAWIAVSSREPLTDPAVKPFVFDHVVPDMYTSATSIFAAGSALKWFKDTLAGEWSRKAAEENRDVFELIIEEAAKSGIGSNDVLFNPTLAGAPASSTYGNIAGAFLNLNLNTAFQDLARSVLEGITFDLYDKYSQLEKMCSLSDKIVIVGGGSKSNFWRQMFADIFGRKFSRISTDQDAAALGAAAVAAVGSGVWKNYSEIDNVIKDLETVAPDREKRQVYSRLFRRYTSTWKMLSEIGTALNSPPGDRGDV